jgi:outer membrane protein OmpA-like peptidoglycan-associated protein
MAESLLTRLTSSVQPSTLAQIATRLGVPEEAVSRGLALSTATLFGAMANKSTDRGAMQQVIDAASRTPADTLATGVSTGQFTDPASSLISSGRSFASSLLGGSSNWATDLIGREAGLGAGATATIMALGAHSLLNYIGSRVRDGSMNASSLSEFLYSEAPAMRKLLPPSFDDAFRTYFPRAASRPIDVNPVVAQAVQKDRSFMPWLAGAAVLAGVLAYGWYGMRHNQMIEPLPSRPVGTSGTLMPPALGRTTTVPSRPAYGVIDNQFLAFITSSRAPDTTSWFDFDQLRFDTASAKPQPQSNEQLTSIAAILKAHPNVRVKIGGYTDNVGSPADNMKLSEARATNVRNELVGMGVDADRLTAEGYGEANPVGDNSTETGRAMNRRISMLVTEK